LDLRDGDGDGPALSLVFGEYAALMSRAERLLLAKLKAGRTWTGDLKVSFYQHLGLTATHLDMAYRQLQGKLKSVSELAAERVKDLTNRIGSKKTDIARKEKAIEKAVAERAKVPNELEAIEAKIAKRQAMLATAKHSLADKHRFALKVFLDQLHGKRAAKDSIGVRISALRSALHQHKRRLAVLEIKLAEARAQAADPSLCFGTRKLMQARYTLEANGFSSRKDWRNTWTAVRSAQFTLDGNSSKESGNQFARLRMRDDGLFDMELRLPKALAHLAQRTFKFAGSDIHCVDLHDLSFNHGHAVIERAIASGKPVCVKFVRDEKSWRVAVTVDDAVEQRVCDYSRGAIGVDLNAGHVAVAYVDASGNPVESFNIPCVTYGRSPDQGKASIRKAATQVADLAARLGVPFVSEKLDFSKKKTALKDSNDPLYARMLSSFAYSAFDAALASACYRRGVAHRRVNPAYTSIIGRVKFARRYGLSVHAAAPLPSPAGRWDSPRDCPVPPMAPSPCRRTALSMSPSHYL
jgi:IS605 OrfB family transposase